MSNLTLLERAENYVSNLFLEDDTSGLFYHNYNHTLSVVEATARIAADLSLSEADKDILLVSAWFHDVGYIYRRVEHEAKSIEIAAFALHPNFTHLIEPVTTCIAATKVGEVPKTPLAALLKDADIAFGSAYDYIRTSNAYREELRVSENKVFEEVVWRQMCIDFLSTVVFYSDYGKTHFTPLVQLNLEKYLKR